MKKISLAHCKASQKYKVVEILGGGNLYNKLMNIGVYIGREVTKISYVGLKGPVVIKVGRGILALGHGVAAKVIVEVT